MPFGCIFVPDFPLAAICRAEPELRSQAVAVLEGKVPQQKVSLANDRAHHAGIRAGMTKLEAEVADQVVLRDRSPQQEAAAHQALLDCAQSFSPRVEVLASDTLLLDLSGLEKLFGSPAKIARQLCQRAFAMGLESSVAVAATLESARLAAYGFSGATVVPEGKEMEFLGSLPIEVLFIPDVQGEKAQQFLETFHRWGIGKFRDLAALPEVALSERLGQEGLELQRRARGLCSRHLVPSHPPLIFEEVLELDYPLVLLEPLAFVLHRMLEHLCARLRARALAAEALSLQFRLSSARSCAPDRRFTCFERNIQLPVPLAEPKTFLQLLQLDLHAHPPGAPIEKIVLRIEPAKPRPAQDGLFLPSSPQAEKLELTLAKISAIVGEGRAGSPELLDTHRPEPFTMRHFTPSPQKSGPNPTNHLVTALRMFRPPLAVSVSFEGGKLARISALKTKPPLQGVVLWATGPWRSCGDWWDEDGWLRDEWDIAVDEKTGIVLYRIVHDLIRRKWLLEGSYD